LKPKILATLFVTLTGMSMPAMAQYDTSSHTQDTVFAKAQDSIPPPRTIDIFITKHHMNGWYSKPDSLKQGAFMTVLDMNENETGDSVNCAYYCVTEYKDGEKHGLASYYKPQNLLVKEIRYESGKLVWIRRYHDNQKLFVETFYGDGKKTGLERTYFPNGILHIETPYSNGLKYGIEKEYYEDGKLKVESPYISGLENGVEKRYTVDGELLPTTMYENGNAQYKRDPTVIRRTVVHHKAKRHRAVHRKVVVQAKKD